MHPPRSSPGAPVRLGRYELLYSLGSGGMGTVWMARARAARGFEKFFVVKTLLAEHADNADFREMFFDEARIASGIDHVNVANIFDFGDEEGTPYLVMEVVDGESLQRIFRALKKRDQQIPPEISLRIVADACGGLHAAHELRDASGQLRDVVHRDISPHNILVSMGGVTKVIDFGIAKARDRVSAPTTTGALKGKLRYMAPEQAGGKAIDRRVDLWALGAVLYLILSGKHAFDGPHDAAVLSQILFGGDCAPLPASVPAGARAVVGRALQRDADGRYATADEMRLDIERALKEMRTPVSTADVAAFMGEHFHVEAEERRAKLAEARGAPTLLPSVDEIPVDVTMGGNATRNERGVLVTEPTAATATDERSTEVNRHVALDRSLAGTTASISSGKRSLFLPVAVSLLAFVVAVIVMVPQSHFWIARSAAPATADTALPSALPSATPVETAEEPFASASARGRSVPASSASSSRLSSPTNSHVTPHPSTSHAARVAPPAGDDPLERAMDTRH